MIATRIAIPAATEDGLVGKRSGHFGHSPHFAVIEINDGKIGAALSLKNLAHEAGGCMQPVGLLAENGVEVLIVGGIGRRPFERLHQQGIKVYFADLNQYQDIQSAVEGFLHNQLPLLHHDQLCTNSGACHH